MFTGIVQQVGVVATVTRSGCGRTLHIDPGGGEAVAAPGDSVAVNGCCLTVTPPDPGSADDAAAARVLRFDVIQQTLRTTALGGLAVGDAVNLEPAVTAATLMSGHLVQGHIDGVGTVRSIRVDAGEHRVRLEPPPELMEFIVDKGSIAIDGVSLTVASIGETWFEVALIPTTLDLTNLGGLREAGRVNIEADYVAKIVVNWMRRRDRAEREEKIDRE